MQYRNFIAFRYRLSCFIRSIYLQEVMYLYCAMAFSSQQWCLFTGHDQRICDFITCISAENGHFDQHISCFVDANVVIQSEKSRKSESEFLFLSGQKMTFQLTNTTAGEYAGPAAWYRQHKLLSRTCSALPVLQCLSFGRTGTRHDKCKLIYYSLNYTVLQKTTKIG